MDLQALLEQRQRPIEIALTMGAQAELAERLGHAPWVPELACRRERLLDQRLRTFDLAEVDQRLPEVARPLPPPERIVEAREDGVPRFQRRDRLLDPAGRPLGATQCQQRVPEAMLVADC